MIERIFKPEVVEEIDRICARYPDRKAGLLPALRVAEREFGHIDPAAMRLVAKHIGVSPAFVYGVVTFYTHFRRETDGQRIIQVCSTLPCALRGSEKIFDLFSKALGIGNNGVTPDGKIGLKKVECLANCDHGPCVQLDEAYIDDLTPELVREIVGSLRDDPAWEPKPQVYALHTNKYAAQGFLLKHVLEDGSHTIDHFLRRGGYEIARQVITTRRDPDDLVQLVKESGLRGRGGAGFPAGMKWSFLPKNDRPRYLVINADESEPGTFKDKLLIDKDPHSLLEGILISAWAVKSHAAYIYIRGEFGPGARTLVAAIDEAYQRGFLGKGCFGTDFALDITVHRGGGAYICGEETGLLSSLEGKRGNPKIKPPFPAVEGAWQCPTIVNNVETICNVPFIVRHGADWFKQFGTERSAGTKLFSVSGHVVRPGNYEVPLGIPLKEIIYELCGGIRGGKKLKAVIPGGSSAPVLTAAEVLSDDPTICVDYESFKEAGTMLGSGGIIVMDEDTCMVDALWNLLRFYHHESCGQCTPCREGTGWIKKIAARFERGEATLEEIDKLDEVAWSMTGRTVCVLADAAAMPTRGIVQKFRAEFEAHVHAGKCPLKHGHAPSAEELAHA